MNRGYTLLWRKTWDNPVFHERSKRYSKLEAWLYLVNVLARGIDESETGLKRGQFEASIRFLARAWNWAKTPVFRYLLELEQNQMITKVERSVERSVERYAERFNVCNYETYNPSGNAERNAERNAKWNKVKEGIKEGIKEGEIKTSSQTAGAVAVDSLPSVDSFRLSNLLRQAIQVRDPKAKAAALPEKDLCKWARDMDKLIRLDGRRAEDIEAVIAWCQNNGNFWGPNILSGRKLREKFDTLWGQMHRGRGKGSPGEDGMHKHQLEMEKIVNAKQKKP